MKTFKRMSPKKEKEILKNKVKLGEYQEQVNKIDRGASVWGIATLKVLALNKENAIRKLINTLNKGHLQSYLELCGMPKKEAEKFSYYKVSGKADFDKLLKKYVSENIQKIEFPNAN